MSITSPIARVEVLPAYRPPWYREDAGSHLPLPPPSVATPREVLPGDVIVWGTLEDQRLPLVSVDGGHGYLRYNWDEWQRYVLTERYYTQHRPLYTWLPFHYHRVPGTLRRLVARAMLAGQSPTGGSRSQFPGFPIEQGLELVNHVRENLNPVTATPTSSGQIVLTHDIDTSAGYRWVKAIAALELSHGFESVWHMVGHGEPPDHTVLDWVVKHGCTIGLHGYNHDNRLAFLSADDIRRRLDACRPIIRRYDIRCFRSPSWFRSETLFEVLADYVTVDYSRLDTDRSCPGGVGGCLWTKSFQVGGLTHMPTTIPFEDPLYWGCPADGLVDFWRPKLDWLRACGGNLVVNTHPEPQFSGNATMLRAYDQLLDVLTDIRDGSNP